MPLPRGVVSDFEEPVWTDVQIAGDTVRMLLKPLTLDDYLDLLGKHGICLKCFGAGENNGEPCRHCGGVWRIPEMVPAFRSDLLALVVRDWKGLTTTDAEGHVVDVPFSPKARDGLARLIKEAFDPIREAAQRLGAQVEEKKES